VSEDLKRLAAEAAARSIESGQRIGLGTGSTARLFLQALGRRLAAGEIRDVVGVPTSRRTAELAQALGIPLASLEEATGLDLAVDGADEVDPQLNLIKGLGGALLREKIVASASRRFIVVVDEGKLVPRLGTRSPLPVEVLPFGWKVASGRIERLGASVVLRAEGGSPYRTDQANYVLDCGFGPIADAPSLAASLASIPGVLGHGLFVGLATEVLVGAPSGVRRLLSPSR
jgi:ribose 5-phosphate isomerase A